MAAKRANRLDGVRMTDSSCGCGIHNPQMEAVRRWAHILAPFAGLLFCQFRFWFSKFVLQNGCTCKQAHPPGQPYPTLHPSSVFLPPNCCNALVELFGCSPSAFGAPLFAPFRPPCLTCPSWLGSAVWRRLVSGVLQHHNNYWSFDFVFWSFGERSNLHPLPPCCSVAPSRPCCNFNDAPVRQFIYVFEWVAVGVCVAVSSSLTWHPVANICWPMICCNVSYQLPSPTLGVHSKKSLFKQFWRMLICRPGRSLRWVVVLNYFT